MEIPGDVWYNDAVHYADPLGGRILDHLKAFRDAALAGGAGCAVVHRPENIRYLSGFAGEGCLFISKEIRAVVTDFRYVEAAGREAPGWSVERTTADRKEADVLKALAARAGAGAALVETDWLTHDAYLRLERALEGVALTPMDGAPERLRQVKDADEIACILEASRIASQAFINILPRLHAGMTEIDAKIELEFEMLRLGSEGPAFDTIAAAGVNGSLPHAVPSAHAISAGELLTLDFGATYRGYRSDITRTVAFGKPSPELRAIYDTVRDAQQLALDAIAPGRRCCDIDRIARDYIDARYPGAFGHSLGHGVGLYIHEQPRVSFNDATELLPGHVVTVEPGVYIPGVGGCRIEDTVILTSGGFINAMHAPKQLIEL